jgi:glucosyl-3-phosphoglycerate synthase
LGPKREPYGATLGGAVSSALSWYARRTFHHHAFPADLLAARRERSTSVLLPARNEAGTIGPILEALLPLQEQGVLDQVAVLDDSTDGTGEIATRLGAEVYDQASLRPEFGPVLGKGDAMWRGLQIARGDVVCFLDADSEDFGAHFALGLLGPVLTGDRIAFVKGFYRRPLRLEGMRLPEGGGRVTELTARPLLNHFYPELAAVLQPLAGEVAARRDLLEQIPFACDYAVDVAMLIDVWRRVGIDGIAQVDLDVRQNQHQPLMELGPMAAAVLAGVLRRVEEDGRLAPSEPAMFLAPAPRGGFEERPVPYVERPPVATLGRLQARSA